MNFNHVILMKRILFFFAFLFLFSASGNASNSIVLEGRYQNKNLFVQNGFNESGVGYCTFEVRVNGQVSLDEINSSAFEIDFNQFQIKPGTEVTVEIIHKDGCKPKVLNPEALKSTASFEIVSMMVDKNGVLKWTAKKENGSLPYIVEQFKWNKWVPVGEVKGVGTAEEHDYSYQTTPHSGENKFRLKQTGYGLKSKYSQPVTYLSSIGKASFTLSEDTNAVFFSRESLYEVYDDYGFLLKKGYSKKVDIANLKKGLYFLCYDNAVEEIKIK